ncbi:hypothetical protein BH10BAC3_BH10BAC3_23670 [soil metagenome]
MFGMRQNSFSQNIGIGITNPTRAKLEVNGAVGYTSAIFGGESTGISFQRNYPGIGFNQYHSSIGSSFMSNGYAAVQFLDPNTGYMGLDMLGNGTANANTTALIRAFTIANNGNMGIGTVPINATLYVRKGTNFDGAAIFGGTQNGSYFGYSNSEDTYIRPGKNGSNVYINDIPNGKTIIGSGIRYVGINSPNPVYPLEIRQTGATGLILVEPLESYNNWEQVVGLYDGGPQSSLKMIYNGQLSSFVRPTDGELISSSDRRLKSNIQPLPAILGKVMQLRPVEYEMKYNNTSHTKTMGFIAQEVKGVFPEMVTVSSNLVAKDITIADFHALNYQPFKILAVKAVQEEQKLIEDLQRQQNEILRRLEAVEKKLPGKN